MWYILYIAHFIYWKKKSNINLHREKNNPRRKILQYSSLDFVTDPQKETRQYIHTDIAALDTLSHRSTSLTQGVVKGRWCWAVPEMLRSVVCAGMSSWGVHEAREETGHLPPGWRSKSDRIMVRTTALIRHGAAWKGPWSSTNFCFFYYLIFLLMFIPFKPLVSPSLPCVLLPPWPSFYCPDTPFLVLTVWVSW